MWQGLRDALRHASSAWHVCKGHLLHGPIPGHGHAGVHEGGLLPRVMQREPPHHLGCAGIRMAAWVRLLHEALLGCHAWELRPHVLHMHTRTVSSRAVPSVQLQMARRGAPTSSM